MAPRVLVVGDVMVDVIVRQLGAFHEGSDTAARIVVAPGGSGANQAVALARAGAGVALIAVVGDDALGRQATQALSASGVEPRLIVAPGQQTGVVVSLVGADGERSMLTDRGANLALLPAHLDGDLFAPGRHFHLSGYDLLDAATRPAALAALALATRAGMTRSVDPSSAGPLAAAGPSKFLAWTEGLEWCCANRAEGRLLTGATRPAEILARLRTYYREVVLTLGRDGALWSGPDVPLLHCPAEPAEVADTTGAGDAFTGTFLAHRLAGEEPEVALRAGLAAAAAAVSRPGARGWV